MRPLRGSLVLPLHGLIYIYDGVFVPRILHFWRRRTDVSTWRTNSLTSSRGFTSTTKSWAGTMVTAETSSTGFNPAVTVRHFHARTSYYTEHVTTVSAEPCCLDLSYKPWSNEGSITYMLLMCTLSLEHWLKILFYILYFIMLTKSAWMFKEIPCVQFVYVCRTEVYVNDCMHCSIHSSSTLKFYLIWTTALSLYFQCCICILTSWIGDLYANNVKSEKSKHFMQICCNWEHFFNKKSPVRRHFRHNRANLQPPKKL